MFGCNTYGRVYVVSISHRIINSIREVSGKRRKKDKESERNSYYCGRRSAERWLQGLYYEPCKERARENINIVVLCCKLHCNTKYSKMQIKLQIVCLLCAIRSNTRVPDEGEELLVLEHISLIYESFVDLQGMNYIGYHRTLQEGWKGSKKQKVKNRMATHEKNPNRINSIP